MKTSHTLREEADRARRLAQGSGDDKTKEILAAYALDLEMQAQHMDTEAISESAQEKSA